MARIPRCCGCGCGAGQQLQLQFDPSLGTSICYGSGPKKQNKKQKNKTSQKQTKKDESLSNVRRRVSKPCSFRHMTLASFGLGDRCREIAQKRSSGGPAQVICFSRAVPGRSSYLSWFFFFFFTSQKRSCFYRVIKPTCLILFIVCLCVLFSL